MRSFLVLIIAAVVACGAYPVAEFFENIDSTKCVSSWPECQSNCFAHPAMQLCGAVHGMVGRDELMTSTAAYPYIPSYAPIVWPSSLYVTLEAPTNWDIPLEISAITSCLATDNLPYLQLLSISDLDQAAPFRECDYLSATYLAGSIHCFNLTCVVEIPIASLGQGYNLFRFSYLNAVTNATIVTSMVVSAGRANLMAGCHLALSGRFVCDRACYMLDGAWVCEDAAIIQTSDYDTAQTVLMAVLIPLSIVILLGIVGYWGKIH